MKPIKLESFKFIETIIWNDGPILYLAEISDQKYIGTSHDENEDLLIPVSEETLSSFKNNEITVRDILFISVNSENKPLITKNGGDNIPIREMTVAEVKEYEHELELLSVYYVDEEIQELS